MALWTLPLRKNEARTPIRSKLRDPNPKDKSLIRTSMYTCNGFHSTFAALFSYQEVSVRVRVPLFATQPMTRDHGHSGCAHARSPPSAGPKRKCGSLRGACPPPSARWQLAAGARARGLEACPGAFAPILHHETYVLAGPALGKS